MAADDETTGVVPVAQPSAANVGWLIVFLSCFWVDVNVRKSLSDSDTTKDFQTAISPWGRYRLRRDGLSQRLSRGGFTRVRRRDKYLARLGGTTAPPTVVLDLRIQVWQDLRHGGNLGGLAPVSEPQLHRFGTLDDPVAPGDSSPNVLFIDICLA